MVNIAVSHTAARGSIPRIGNNFFLRFIIFPAGGRLNYILKLQPSFAWQNGGAQSIQTEEQWRAGLQVCYTRLGHAIHYGEF